MTPVETIIQKYADRKAEDIGLPESMNHFGNFTYTSYEVYEMIKDVLTDYTEYLLNAGYCDSDIYCEGNSAIDRYIHPMLRNK